MDYKNLIKNAGYGSYLDTSKGIKDISSVRLTGNKNTSSVMSYSMNKKSPSLSSLNRIGNVSSTVNRSGGNKSLSSMLTGHYSASNTNRTITDLSKKTGSSSLNKSSGIKDIPGMLNGSYSASKKSTPIADLSKKTGSSSLNKISSVGNYSEAKPIKQLSGKANDFAKITGKPGEYSTSINSHNGNGMLNKANGIKDISVGNYSEAKPLEQLSGKANDFAKITSKPGEYSTSINSHNGNGMLNKANGIKDISVGNYSEAKPLEQLSGKADDFVKITGKPGEYANVSGNYGEKNSDALISNMTQNSGSGGGYGGYSGAIPKDGVPLRTGVPTREDVGANGEKVFVTDFSNVDARSDDGRKILSITKDANGKTIETKYADDNVAGAKELAGSAKGIVSSMSGGGSANTKIELNQEQVTQAVNGLKEAINTIDSLWKDIMNTEIPAIQNSWLGSDAQSYISKVTDFNSKINASNNAINLLSSTLEQSANLLKDTQSSVTKDINAL